MKDIDWRSWIGRGALPLLALSAAWGVYQYNLLFVPWWVAACSALAFEAVYVALAIAPTANDRRALAVALAAVGVSVAYNTLSALFHRRPELLDAPPIWADVALAALHGVPLAMVAYNVAALLLHSQPPAPPPGALQEVSAPQLVDETIVVARREISLRQLAKLVEKPETTLRRQLAQLEDA